MGIPNWNSKIGAKTSHCRTIQTEVVKDNIKQIIRQGDCVFVEPRDTTLQLGSLRSITKEEYIHLLKLES